MDYDDLPKRRVHTPRGNPGNWSCNQCHWQNPGICKACGNCGRPRKEETCHSKDIPHKS